MTERDLWGSGRARTKDEVSDTVMGAFALVGVFAYIVAMAIINGIVVGTLWAWFVMPVFHLPALSIPYAIGLALLVSHMTRDVHTPEKVKKAETGKLFVQSLVNPAMVLFMGFIIHLFV